MCFYQNLITHIIAIHCKPLKHDQQYYAYCFRPNPLWTLLITHYIYWGGRIATVWLTWEVALTHITRGWLWWRMIQWRSTIMWSASRGLTTSSQCPTPSGTTVYIRRYYFNLQILINSNWWLWNLFLLAWYIRITNVLSTQTSCHW